MDSGEIRSLLSLYRAGDDELKDPRFDEARERLETDPALARWWAEEQELDRVIASKLQNTHVPVGLKARILERRESVIPFRATTWTRKLTLLAAVIVILAVLFSSWRGVFQPAGALADYRDEMVSFVKVNPTLELETSNLAQVSAYLGERGAPSNVRVPTKLQQMEPVGCRVLRFRGHDVSLICFKRGDGKLVHLFVMDRAAFSRLRSDGAASFQEQGDWTTAMWTEGNQAYLLATQGDRARLEKYLSSS